MRYIVGIDLGTTNCAVACVDLESPDRVVQSIPIPQLVADGTIADRPTLPSFLYVGGEHDVAPGALALPWDRSRDYAVGEFARLQGARVPGRLVTSAKSWLCHGGVDRDAAILPWAAPDDVPRLSPVDVCARLLQHVREIWQQRFGPDTPLEDQQIMLTVPASFDEVARELTALAAERAGLSRVVLLEEPQAAFYAWIHRNEKNWQQQLADVRLVAVVDVGGGTSDFSLIAVRRDGDEVALERLAVGDHILLGGDNIDVALARLLEPRLGEKLDSQRWHALTNLCRAAKESLLAADAPAEVPVRLIGRGRSVVGGTVTASLSREEVTRLVMDGFFPSTPADAAPRRSQRLGLQEWGLPFASEAEIPRHLAAFLRAHENDQHPGFNDPTGLPDALLFNGGALKPPRIRERLCDLLANWRGQPPTVLESGELDLAVASGAAYYGLARRGLGVRIGGGSPRAFYLGLAATPTADESADISAVCIVPRGMHEGEEIEITDREFSVLANRPASFPLYASNTRLGDPAGGVIRAEPESLSSLPPIRTVLRFGKKLAATTIPVHIVARLTEVGTLEAWCRSLQTDHRWRLQFNLRESLVGDEEEPVEADSAAELDVVPARQNQAAAMLRAVFAPDSGAATGDPVTLVREMESAIGAGKDAWPLTAIRPLWDVLWEGREARGIDQTHEARWLNLCGFLLRPGFGHELDDWRVQQLWKLYSQGLRFPRAVQCRVEWWNLWKRIAGGLSETQQIQLYNKTAPFLLSRLKSRIKGKRSAVGPQELREYWQLLASCERLPATTKAELGSTLLPAVLKGKATDAETWALGRFGARAPFSGPLNCVVGRETVHEWIEKLLDREWRRAGSTAFAAVQLARCVGDRERDLDESLRIRLAERLDQSGGGQRGARLVREFVPLDAQERTRILDESLPVGLRVDMENSQTLPPSPVAPP